MSARKRNARQKRFAKRKWRIIRKKGGVDRRLSSEFAKVQQSKRVQEPEVEIFSEEDASSSSESYTPDAVEKRVDVICEDERSEPKNIIGLPGGSVGDLDAVMDMVGPRTGYLISPPALQNGQTSASESGVYFAKLQHIAANVPDVDNSDYLHGAGEVFFEDGGSFIISAWMMGDGGVHEGLEFAPNAMYFAKTRSPSLKDFFHYPFKYFAPSFPTSTVMRMWEAVRVAGVAVTNASDVESDAEDLRGNGGGDADKVPSAPVIRLPSTIARDHKTLLAFVKKELWEWCTENPMVALVNACPGARPNIPGISAHFVKKYGMVPFTESRFGVDGDRFADCLLNAISNALHALGAGNHVTRFRDRAMVEGIGVKKIGDVAGLFRSWAMPFDAQVPFRGEDAFMLNRDPFRFLGRARSYGGVFLVFLYGFSFHCVVVDGDRGLIWDDVDSYPLRLYASLLNKCGCGDGTTRMSVSVRRIVWSRGYGPGEFVPRF